MEDVPWFDRDLPYGFSHYLPWIYHQHEDQHPGFSHESAIDSEDLTHCDWPPVKQWLNPWHHHSDPGPRRRFPEEPKTKWHLAVT